MATAPKKTLQGPRGHWLLGCLRQFQRDPLTLYTQANRDYGHYVRIRAFPGIYVYLLTHPEAVEHVLQKNHKNYRKPDFFNKTVGLLAGNGILTSEGDFWLRQRRLMQPAFHRQHLAKLAPLMVAAAESFVREQQAAGPGQVVDILDAMMKVALRIAGNTLFSTDITGEADEIGRAFRTAFAYVSRRMNSPPLIPTWFPTPRNLAFARARRLLNRVVLGLIAARRRAASRPDDLLTLLLAAQDEESGAGMTDQQVKDEALTLLTAGHETVGAALSWTWYLLGQHPQIQADLYDEIRGKLQGRSPTLDDLPGLPLTKAVFEESLRLYPPAWGQPRESIRPDEINGFPIPAKAIITVNQWVTHRHPDFWDEPETFKPERFLPGRAEGRHKFAYFPFGGGPRVCIGNTFALLEGPLVLATLVQQFRVELVPGQSVVPDPTFTLRPKTGVKVLLWPR
ncbi:MAG TPA: cytochrome P450 [Gemmataceae bacterium]|nr:cytochrome P450 [Gemmataceae bacterium]